MIGFKLEGHLPPSCADCTQRHYDSKVNEHGVYGGLFYCKLTGLLIELVQADMPVFHYLRRSPLCPLYEERDEDKHTENIKMAQ